MWVAGGCRGTFVCHGARTGICGGPKARAQAAANDAKAGDDWPLVVCSCEANVTLRDAINARWWRDLGHAEEVAQSLRGGMKGASTTPRLEHNGIRQGSSGGVVRRMYEPTLQVIGPLDVKCVSMSTEVEAGAEGSCSVPPAAFGWWSPHFSMIELESNS
jgi:hypothetical protein